MTKKRKAKTGTVHFYHYQNFFSGHFFFISNCKGGEKFLGTKFTWCFVLFLPVCVHVDNITRYMTIVDESPESTLQQEQEPFTEIEE